MNEADIQEALKKLINLGHDPSGWNTLYRDPSDNSLWEVTYPHGEMHGGGPRELKSITPDQALLVYGLRTEIDMLNITNLHAEVDSKPILKGLTLAINAGEIHAIMGPNGAGKSTLSYVVSGRPGYEVTEGSVTLDGQDLLALAPHERAAAGLFLGFQYPVEIPGVSNVQFLREALNSQRRARGEDPLSGADFLKLARAQAQALGLDLDMLKRPVNVGFSGGEKKRNEMVQMGIIAPKLAILDETDSGLDIDALKAVGHGINTIMRAPDKAVLLITHYQRLLDYVQPDFVHVLAGGRIVRSGGPELAHELEREGYVGVAA